LGKKGAIEFRPINRRICESWSFKYIEKSWELKWNLSSILTYFNWILRKNYYKKQLFHAATFSSNKYLADFGYDEYHQMLKV